MGKLNDKLSQVLVKNLTKSFQIVFSKISLLIRKNEETFFSQVLDENERVQTCYF